MRRPHQLRRLTFFLLLAACGSRTGLFGDDELGTFPVADGGPAADAGPMTDAPPLLDVRPPTDVDRRDCPDAEALLVYTMTDEGDLQSFNPDTGQFRNIGRIACPVQSNTYLGRPNTPFSMAVDRRGTAYVLFRDERLYRVSTATGACTNTSYVRRQSNFGLFGMGFATNSVGPTETLFIAGDDNQSSQLGASGLGRIDPTTFGLTPVGDFQPAIDQAELTGTGDGRLFAFYKKGNPPDSPPSYIGEIDTTTGQVIGERRFDTVDQGDGWAFAFWGGAFYMFHAPGGSTRITRWRPSDDSVTQVATTNLTIVGAGVSTCAPQ